MILVLGGAFQGKKDFARDHFGDKAKYITDIEERFKTDKASLIDEINDKLLKNEQLIIIGNEIGSGIVPIDKEERSYREEYGRYLCELAKNSSEVWRVFCGIGMRIK